MKASEVVKEISSLIEEFGDMNVLGIIDFLHSEQEIAITRNATICASCMDGGETPKLAIMINDEELCEANNALPPDYNFSKE